MSPKTAIPYLLPHDVVSALEIPQIDIHPNSPNYYIDNTMSCEYIQINNIAGIQPYMITSRPAGARDRVAYQTGIYQIDIINNIWILTIRLNGTSAARRFRRPIR